ncbi:MAG: hypothetical protein D6706_05140 [Chloroflexi bacterium]|nr:MAG: hypothetical protein D6706_05140 [Chloroflexota bacterium]
MLDDVCEKGQALTNEQGVGKRPFLSLLLLIDLIFIFFHILYRFTPLLGDARYSLEHDQGFSEFWQYLKISLIILLLWPLLWRRRQPLYLFWMTLFGALVADDAWQFHEKTGEWLAQALSLQEWFGLRPVDWGELLVFTTAGLFFLILLTIAYRYSDLASRRLTAYLVLLVGLLGVVGVGVDMMHQLPWQGLWDDFWAIVEDGGELLIMSVLVWCMYLLGRRELAGNGEQGARISWGDVWPIPSLAEWLPGVSRLSAAQQRMLVTAVSLFVLFVALLAIVQYGSDDALAGIDGYYHIKMGYLVRHQGIKPSPPKLPLTILNEQSFYDHHLLYHIYLAPFAATDPLVDEGAGLIQGAKIATILLAALAFTAVWWLLRSQHVPWASGWAVSLLMVSEAFLFRMNMPRAQSASLLFMVLGLYVMFTRRYRWLMVLGFAYVWLFDGFPLLLVVAGCYAMAALLTEHRFPWQALVFTLVGFGLGLVINPYFPQNVEFVVRHILPKIVEPGTAVGNEWYPYETWTLMKNSGYVFGVLFAGVMALGWREKRMDGVTLTALLITAVTGVMLFKSRRFIEYFPAFVVIFTAFSATPVLVAWREKRPSFYRWLPLLFALILLPTTLRTLNHARASMANTRSGNRYVYAMRWLHQNSPSAATVFQTDWDDFPFLFFFDSDKVYTIGLDPTYMELADKTLFDEWVDLTRGKIENPGEVIIHHFNADFVFTDTRHEAFMAQAADDPHLQQVYWDLWAAIYRVVPDD